MRIYDFRSFFGFSWKSLLTLKNLLCKQVFSAIPIKTLAAICNISVPSSLDIPIATDKSAHTPSELAVIRMEQK